MTWFSVRIRFYFALATVVVMIAVATLFLSLLTLEAKISYGKYRFIQQFKYTPKGKHRRLSKNTQPSSAYEQIS